MEELQDALIVGQVLTLHALQSWTSESLSVSLLNKSIAP